MIGCAVANFIICILHLNKFAVIWCCAKVNFTMSVKHTPREEVELPPLDSNVVGGERYRDAEQACCIESAASQSDPFIVDTDNNVRFDHDDNDFAGFRERDIVHCRRPYVDQSLLANTCLYQDVGRSEQLPVFADTVAGSRRSVVDMHVPRSHSPRSRCSSMSNVSAATDRSLAAREALAKLKAASEFRDACDVAQQRKLAAEQEKRKLDENRKKRELELLVRVYESEFNVAQDQNQINMLESLGSLPAPKSNTGTIPKSSFPRSVDAVHSSSAGLVNVAQPVVSVDKQLYPEFCHPLNDRGIASAISHSASRSETSAVLKPAISLPKIEYPYSLPRVSESFSSVGCSSSAAEAPRVSFATLNCQSNGPKLVSSGSGVPRSSLFQHNIPNRVPNNQSFASRGDSDIIGLAHLLAEFQRENRLPKREPSKFSGANIEDYVPFEMEFKSMIESSCSDKSMLYSYLVNYTEGEAGEIVRSCFSSDQGVAYDSAREALSKRYGDSYLLAHQFIAKLKAWPVIKKDSPEDLRRFSVFLARIGNMCQRSTHFEVLNNNYELKAIVDKLPGHLVNSWGRRAYDIIRRQQVVTFGDLVEFVNVEADIACQPYFGAAGGVKSTGFVSGSATGKRVLATTVESGDVAVNNGLPGQNEYIVLAEDTVTNGAGQGNNVGEQVCATNVETVEPTASNVKTDFGKRGELCWGCNRSGHRLDSCQEFVTLEVKDQNRFLDSKSLCIYCHGKHTLIKCRRFVALRVSQRREFCFGVPICALCVSAQGTEQGSATRVHVVILWCQELTTNPKC